MITIQRVDHLVAFTTRFSSFAVCQLFFFTKLLILLDNWTISQKLQTPAEINGRNHDHPQHRMDWSPA